MTDAELAAALGRVVVWVLAGGLAALTLVEALHPHVAFADERARLRHLLVNLGVWLSGYALVDWWLVPWLQLRIGVDPSRALLSLASLPGWAQAIAGILVLDFAEWLLHVIQHRVRPLWLIHAVHHSDPHLDASTALRHHPLEVLVTLLWQSGLLWVVGLPMWVLMLRGIVGVPIGLYQHANLRLPPALDRVLGLVIASPGIHRVHHSPRVDETNANYGTVFSFWDRLFGTYRAPDYDRAPAYGLARLRAPEWQGVSGMLATPFKARGIATL
ncbi:MAG TPA: sterol desaturase family protein [Casimicrobiaceae bacterium]|jgi:sterol desaturase/sphingolipid hydroxylase (fatty acid hydroxylase superfamily)